jgi:hypothetical protein
MIQDLKTKSFSIVFWSLMLLLSGLHGHLFLEGYRLSADDVMYHSIFMGGMQSILEFIHTSSLLQGRAGNYLNSPLLLVGAYYADHAIFRIAYVVLYFINFYLFAKYISYLIDCSVRPFILMVMIIFNPLGYNLSPPNAYPLLLSIPFLMILCARLSLINRRQQDGLRLTRQQSIALVIFSFAILINEYAFIFGMLLIIAEHIKRIFRPNNPGANRSFLRRIQPSTTDVLSVSLVLAIYLGFRWAFPSQYDGNMPNGLSNFFLVIKTISAHLYFGLSLAPSTTLQGTPILVLPFKTIPILQILNALLTFVISFFLVLMVSISFKRPPYLKSILFFAILLAILACLPIAITAKYQGWLSYCKLSEGGPGCSYIDSRIAYYPMCVALAAVFWMLLPLKRVALSDTLRIYLVALLIAFISAFTYLHNWRTAQFMKTNTAVWVQASQIACTLELDAINDDELIQLLDPQRLTPYHPDFIKGSYWRLYIADQKKHQNCDSAMK